MPEPFEAEIRDDPDDLRAELKRSRQRVRALESELRGLQMESRRLSALVNDSGAGFLVIDPDRRVIWTNPTFRRDFRDSDEESAKVLGRPCNEVLCGRPTACEDCFAARCIETGAAAQHELRMWIRDRYRDILATGIPVEGARGAVDQVMVMLLDVTDLEAMRRSDEAFMASEKRFRSIFERVPVGMVALKNDGSFLQANPAFCTMLGYTESELLRRKMIELIHPEDRRPGSDGVGREEEPRAEEVVQRYIRRDGNLLWGRTTTIVHRGRGQRPAYVLALIQDITQRMQAEQQLERTRQDYETLLDSVDGIVWEADPDTLRFLYVSEQAVEILGFPLDRWLSQPRFWRNQIHTDDLDHVLRTISHASRVRGSYELEYRMIAADGRTVWLRDLISVVDGLDGQPRMRGTMFDITSHKLAEPEPVGNQER